MSDEDKDDIGLKCWKQDMQRLELGTKLLFMNDFQGSESVFRSGMRYEEERQLNARGVRDLRSAFALQYALVSVIKGISSLANDQLDECLKRIWFAEELSAEEIEEWIGKDVVRGLCILMGGVIQVLQQSFVKGVYNILKSWVYIKKLPEALSYEGKEKAVVRSAALFTLGVFNILLSLLPPAMLSTASYISGFSADSVEGVDMLHKCWKEEGMLSPWAALVWCAYHVDTKTFLEQTQTQQDFDECARIFEWVRNRYGQSVFFSGLEADYSACLKNIDRSLLIIESATPLVGELKALEWALNYKRGIYELVNLQFAKAAQSFETSIGVYERVGRRSMVPFMAMYSALCYLVVADQKAKAEQLLDDASQDGLSDDGSSDSSHDDDDADSMDAARAAAHAEEMLALVHNYREMKKDNWGRQDLWAFKVAKDYEMKTMINDVQVKPWPLLDLVDCMILRMRCTRWMTDTQAAQLLELLSAQKSERLENFDDELRYCTYFCEILLERKQYEAALEWCERGLVLVPDISAKGAEEGHAPWLLYLKALNLYQRGYLLTSSFCLDKVEKFGKSYWIYHYVVFKLNILRKQIAHEMKSKQFHQLKVPAGDSKPLVYEIAKSNTLVVWDWTCKSYDIVFSIFFRSVEEDEPVLIDSGRHESGEDAPQSGYYLAERPGQIIFEFDNKYSMWRSKEILYQITIEEVASKSKDSQ